MQNRGALSALAALGLVIITAAPSGAQEPTRAASSLSDPESNSGGLQEVVVTAQKRAERQQDVPIAVETISNDTLTKSAVVDTHDIQTVISGITLAENGDTLEPHIRGIGTTNNSPGAEQPVAIYVDGVYLSSATENLLSMNDVEQLAVLKGPQGTLFGRNATAGVIQVTTRDPGREVSASANASVDNFATVRVDGYVGGPLAGQWSTGLSGLFISQQKGWGTNLVTGRDIRRINHEAAFRNKWVYDNGDNTRLKLSVDYTDRADSMSPAFAILPGTRPFFPDAISPRNPWDVAASRDPESALKSGGASLTLEHDRSFIKLVNILATRASQLTWTLDDTASPTPGLYFPVTQKANQVTEELQFLSPDASSTKWAGGIYYIYSKAKADPVDLQFSPAYFTQLGAPAQTLEIWSYGTQIAHSLAGYAQVTQQILPRLNLTAGGRYTTETRSFLGSESASADGGPVGYILPPRRDSLEFNKATWRAALDYKVATDVLLYVSDSRGFKSGGFNLFDPTQAPYEPETLDDYEFGFKTEWFNRRLRVNGGVFRYDYTNIQVNKYTVTQQIVNGAKARIDGLELQFEANVMPGLTVTAAPQWLDPIYTKYPDASFYHQDPATGFFLADPVGFDARGKQLPYAPRFTLNAGVQYAISLAGGSLSFNLANFYSTRYYSEPDNGLVQRPYDILNASITWQSPGDRYRLSLFGRNLRDAAYYTQLATQQIGEIGEPTNSPRAVGISVGWNL